MAGERMSARFSLRSQLWFRWTGKCFETATSHMQTVSGNLKKKDLRIISTIFLILSLSSCKNEKKFDIKSYVLNPSNTDTECLNEIEQANKDIENGKIVFTHPCHMFDCVLRQEKYVFDLCKKYNIHFEYEAFSDIIIEGQTQGCYGAVMDNYINKKFGKDFKSKILKDADSILLASNDTIIYYNCDKKPQIPGKGNYETTFVAKLPEKLIEQIKPSKEGNLPFMDIGFYIDKSGKSSGFFLNYFMKADKLNYKFKDELFKIGVEQLKEIKYWETGEINGQKVNTENNIRVYF